MNLARSTRSLLVAVLVVGALDVGVRLSQRVGEQAEIGALPAFDAAAVDRIRVGRVDRMVVLERRGERWFVAAPSEAPADGVAIRALLAELAPGVRPLARVDEEELDRYGLAGGSELAVSVEAAGRPLLSLTLGHDAPGGGTWLRWPGDDSVLRADVGGRGPFDRAPVAWRDPTIVDLDPEAIVAMRLENQRASVRVARQGAGWVSDAGWAVDGPTMAALVTRVARWRALEVAAPGQVDRRWGIELEVRDRDPVRLHFEQRGALFFVGIAGTDQRFRVGLEVPYTVARMPHALHDRHLWGPLEQRVIRFERRGAGPTGVLVQGEAGLSVVQPPGLDTEPERARAAVDWLVAPRVHRWAEPGLPDADFGGSRHSWRVTFSDGAVRTLELGGSASVAGKPCVAVRVQGRQGWVEERVVRGIEGLF